MKSALARILICCLLFSQTELHELLKLPALVMHYTEHLDFHPELSVIDFLMEHYADQHSCNHNSRHNHNLPFQDTHGCLITLVCAIVPATDEITSLCITSPKTHQAGRTQSFISRSFADIWQPPKI